ncbi:MAG: hypothetical protein Q8908_01285, partial [Bacteroidota bacterium]|nr:hypothetical protein [Bacteroidota bacterium]
MPPPNHRVIEPGPVVQPSQRQLLLQLFAVVFVVVDRIRQPRNGKRVVDHTEGIVVVLLHYRTTRCGELEVVDVYAGGALIYRVGRQEASLVHHDVVLGHLSDLS